jgi:ADP-L-glycero-D-manno-heptose 6-epimerase
MIIVTGACGFIGKHLCKSLIDDGARILAVVLKEDVTDKPRRNTALIESGEFRRYLSYGRNDKVDPEHVTAVIHLGACTDTECNDEALLADSNTKFTSELWDWCTTHGKPFIYASSASVYGAGPNFSDDPVDLREHKPLNAYARSKYAADLRAMERVALGSRPPRWAGLRFFNVYGAGEEHKGKMASMVHQLLLQVREKGCVRLFRDGEQKRDFVHVGDVVQVIRWALNANVAGFYNVGTGEARSFNDVAYGMLFHAKTFNPLLTQTDVDARIVYFDMPEHLKGKYQEHTCADLSGLRLAGYQRSFTPLEDGIRSVIEETKP